MREWIATNAEHRCAYNASRKDVNAQRVRERMRTDSAFVERRRAYGRSAYARNKEAYKARAAERDRKYKLRGANGLRYDRRDVLRLMTLQKGRCFWCDAALDRFHVDHLVPLSKGGEHEVANLVLACPTCNLRKHAMLPMDFAARLREEAA